VIGGRRSGVKEYEKSGEEEVNSRKLRFGIRKKPQNPTGSCGFENCEG